MWARFDDAVYKGLERVWNMTSSSSGGGKSERRPSRTRFGNFSFKKGRKTDEVWVQSMTRSIHVHKSSFHNGPIQKFSK